jgi:hypothetical protein
LYNSCRDSLEHTKRSRPFKSRFSKFFGHSGRDRLYRGTALLDILENGATTRSMSHLIQLRHRTLKSASNLAAIFFLYIFMFLLRL